MTVWAIGQPAIIEIANTVRVIAPPTVIFTMVKLQLYPLFCLYYFPTEGNECHSRADFFAIPCEPCESPADVCKTLLNVGKH